jgi:hypothetical protein
MVFPPEKGFPCGKVAWLWHINDESGFLWQSGRGFWILMKEMFSLSRAPPKT